MVRYLNELLVPPDDALTAALEAGAAAGLPSYEVSPTQGKLLALLARAIHARQILELGTLAGYSTIWLARALVPGGRLVTVEANPRHADLARANLARAGLANVVDVRVGQALDVLAELASEAREPFDFVFIDADKANNAEYFERSLALCRPGSLIIADNVIREGTVIDPATSDASAQGIRRFNEAVSSCPRVSATTLQTVGSKGWDGIAIVLVTGN